MDELKNGHYKTQLYAEDHDSRKKQNLIKGLNNFMPAFLYISVYISRWSKNQKQPGRVRDE